MTISTRSKSTFTISFLIFNLLMFWTFKIMIVNKIISNKSALLTYLIIIAAAIFADLIYILINVYFTHRLEEKIISNSTYLEDFDFSYFIGSTTICILRLEDDKCQVYINYAYLEFIYYYWDVEEYIFELETSFDSLNKMDKIFIYLYKYMNTALMSIFLFVIWQICDSGTIAGNVIVQTTTVMFIALILLGVYYIANKIAYKYITKYIRKRDLTFLIFE